MKQKITIHKLKLEIEVELPLTEELRDKIYALLNANPRKPIRERLKALRARLVSAYPELADGAEAELAAIQRAWFQDTPKVK